eukprot:1663445-Rhodomonas_salina.3
MTREKVTTRSLVGDCDRCTLLPFPLSVPGCSVVFRSQTASNTLTDRTAICLGTFPAGDTVSAFGLRGLRRDGPAEESVCRCAGIPSL